MFGKQQFVGKVEGSVTDKYELVKEIGSGAYGKVFKVRDKFSGETRACKQLAKGKIANMEKFKLEINIMIQIDHPNIIKLYEVYEDSRYVYLIMEECTGGELFDRIYDRITKKNLYTEKEAAAIFKQYMSAVCHCHSQQICHRDLKPENLLFLNDSPDSPLKVIDFGLSKIYTSDNHRMSTKVGTAYYVSPEVLEGNYDEKCDIWSSGVILYILLTGEPPFNGPNDNEIYRRIAKKNFSFPSPTWDKISNDVKNLITRMLADPKDRYSAEEVLHHNWVSNLAPNSEDSLLNLNVETMKSYTLANKFKKAALTFIATRLKDDEISSLKDIFSSLDKNNDGTLTFEEIKQGCSILNANLDFEEIFVSLDTDRSGCINYTEFIAATIDQRIYLKNERLFEAFKSFDKDNSGKISVNEIGSIINLNKEDFKNLEEEIKRFDLNGDGEIDYNEFCNMMAALNMN